MPEGEARPVSVTEIRKNTSPDSCWIVVDGHVWDLTEYAPDHPGGSGIILRHAGRDATETYNSIHAPSVLSENLDSSKYIGRLDTNTLDPEWAKPPPKATPEVGVNDKPSLNTVINLQDFEDIAEKTFSKKTWAFYSSGATDCITRDRNRKFFKRIIWRPRVLRNVKTIDQRSSILGHEIKSPLFISPAAMAKLVHPEGEKALARSCESESIMQMISTNASYPVSDIAHATSPSHPFIFQLYINSDRTKTRALITHLLTLRPYGLIGICITVDAAVPGKREADERLKADEDSHAPNSGSSAPTGGNDKRGGGLGRIMGAFIDPSLCWDDIKWIRGMVGPDMPLLIKGVQGAADARLAVQHGLQGIVVGNHGGRSLDTAPAAVMVLLELRRECPEVFEKLEVLVDGGIRRGTDVLKCVCLGAKAVGLGRPPLYALAYGQEGVEHCVDILKDELETTMRLVGIDNLSQAHPGLINTLDLDHLIPKALDERPWWRSWLPRARL